MPDLNLPKVQQFFKKKNDIDKSLQKEINVLQSEIDELKKSPKLDVQLFLEKTKKFFFICKKRTFELEMLEEFYPKQAKLGI